MALKDDIEEYNAVKAALRAINTGSFEASVSVGGMSVSYTAQQIPYLERRERVLASRIAGIQRKRMRIYNGQQI